MYKVLRITYITIFAFLGILYTLYFIPHTAYAAGMSLKTQPANLQIRTIAPADIKAPFTIENTGSEVVSLRISFSRFTDSGESLGRPLYTNLFTETKVDPLLKNVQLFEKDTPVTTIRLGPLQKKELMLSIPVLKEEAAKDHYFSLVFLPITEQNPAEISQTTFSTIQAGIALPVLLSIGTDKEKTGVLQGFSTSLFFQEGPVPFEVEVANTGSHFRTVEGVILITNMFGQTVGKIDIPKTNVLAENNRFLKFNDYLAAEIDSPKVIWDEKVLFGLYTAKLSIAFQPEQTLYTQSTSFVAFPLIGLAGLLFLLLLLVFIVLRVKKKISQG